MSDSEPVRHGSCLCGAIKFTVTGKPARNIQCSCINCQKASGSAMSTNVLYLYKQYDLHTGADKLRIYEDSDTKSGGSIQRAFCSICGSSMSMRNVSNPKMSQNIVVCAGSLEDNYKDFVPQSELFPERRHKWVPAVQRKKKEGKL